MSWEQPLMDVGDFTAGGNYSAATNYGLCVYSTGGTSFKTQTTKGGPVLGVLQDTPSSGQTGKIRVWGVTKVRVTAATHTAIVTMDKLIASSGAGVRGSSGTGNVGLYVVGRAMSGIGANTTGIIAMLITHQGAGSTTAQTGA